MKKAFLIFGAIVCSLATLSAGAQNLTGTLKKAADSNTFTVGYREASVPFSYLGADAKPTGYAFDICMKIVDAVKQATNRPNLQVKYLPITSGNRIPLLQNGAYDVECGSTTNSVERQKAVSFSTTYFVIGVTAAVKKDSGVNSLKDLANKTLSFTSGTTAAPLMLDYAKKNGFTFRTVFGKDHAESMQLVASGRATAFVIDDVLLAGQIANQAKPDSFKILQGKENILRTEPYATMIRKGDDQFKKLCDTVITGMIQSGEMATLYHKWFEQPIPPRNVNMKFPMSEAMKNAMEHPNDKGV